jgi:hypothetical protein
MSKANMKRAGFLLMSGGFLWGSFITVNYLEHVEWTPYAIAFVLTAVGAVLTKLSQRISGEEAGRVKADISTIEDNLQELVEKVKKMNVERDEIDVFAFGKRIDDDCMGNINDFVEAREALSHRFGLDKYAEMMDAFAMGERSLNRAWCAGADGYIDEVHLCLDRAQLNLERALAVVKQCVSGDKASDAPRADASSESSPA